jgi:hypothetical protein
MGRSCHYLVHFNGQGQAIHIAAIKPTEIALFFESSHHSVNPTSVLPCSFIVSTHGFGAFEGVATGCSVATRASVNQSTRSADGTGTRFQCLQGPGQDIVKLTGFGEFIHFAFPF